MNAIDKRLAALEAISPVTYGENERGCLAWLSLPSFPEIVAEFAERRARRTIAGVDWRRLTDDERRARFAQELHALCGTDPDDWPDGDAERFARRLATHRQMMDTHRGWAGALAAAWRARNPEWRPRMREAEFDQWEIVRMRTD